MSTWLNAATTAAKILSEGKTRAQILEGFHYKKDILKAIKKHELLNFSGKTPYLSLNNAINQDIKDNPHTSKFVRVQSPSKGYFALREEHHQEEESDDEQPKEEEEDPEEEKEKISEKQIIFELSDLLNKCKEQFSEASELTKSKIPSFLSKKIDSIIDKSSHERFRSQWVRSNYRSVVVLGRTGIGKSFLLNALTRILMQQYTEDTNKHDPNIAGALHQLIADLPEEYPHLTDEKLNGFVEEASQHRNKHEYFTSAKKQKQIFEQEEQVESLFKKYHEQAMLSLDDKEDLLYKFPFFFPSKSEDGATTAFPTILRYGYVPALFVKYYSFYEEIEFPAQYVTREKYLLSKKVNKEELKKFLGKTQVYIGQGKNSILDRVYIRDMYEDIYNNKGAFHAIEKIYVYLPCLMLFDRFEIVDLPGFNDKNEVRMNHLLKYLKDAKVIWALTNNNLESSADLVNFIQDSKILSKIIEDPVTYGLVIAHMPEKEANVPSKRIMERYVKTNERVEERTIGILKEMVTTAYEEIENPFMDTKEALIGATLAKIERFSIWPFLFASMIEAKKKPPMDILEATGGLRLLGNIQKLIYGKLLDTMDHYMDEFASVTEDLNILSKSITVESTPPNAFFSKLEKNETKDFMYDVELFKGKVDDACAEMIDNSLDDKFFPLSLYVDVTKAFLEAINEVSDSSQEEKKAKYSSYVSVILSRKRPQISRRNLGNRINIKINQIIVEFADDQWKAWNERLLKYASKENKETVSEFLNYFKFFKLVMQSAIEKTKPTITCSWAKNMYMNIFEEKLCAEKLSCESHQELETILKKINKETLRDVRTRAKGEVHKQVESHFYKADNLQKTLKRCAKEYVSIILLNSECDLNNTLNKGDLHNSFSALAPSVIKLEKSYKALQDVRAAYRKMNKLSSETATIGKSVYEKNVHPPYFTQFVDCCLEDCNFGHEAVNGEMIQCDYCGIWFHISCYQERVAEIDIEVEQWFCLYCRQPTAEVTDDEQATQDEEAASQETICYTSQPAPKILSTPKRKQPERATKRMYDLSVVYDDDDDLDYNNSDWEAEY